MKRFSLLFLIAAGLTAFYQVRVGGFASRPDREALRLPGQVELREVTLSFRVAGLLGGLNVEVGERVKSGQTLAWLSRAPFEYAEINRKEATLPAPGDGVILSRLKEPGSFLPVETAIYTLALDSPVWARAYAGPSKLEQLQLGQAVRVRTDSGGVYEGRINYIPPLWAFIRTKTGGTAQPCPYPACHLRVLIKKPGQNLRQGQPVTVDISLPLR